MCVCVHADSKRLACHDVKCLGVCLRLFVVAIAWMLQSRITGMICGFYVWKIGLSLG